MIINASYLFYQRKILAARLFTVDESFDYTIGWVTWSRIMVS